MRSSSYLLRRAISGKAVSSPPSTSARAATASAPVGEPVTVPQIKDPSPETVDRYHNMYICSLLKLFHEHKMKYGLGENAELRIL